MNGDSNTGALPTSFTLRPLEQADVAPVATIMAANSLWQRYGVTTATAASRLHAGSASGATIVVAEVGRAVAGFVWYVAGGAFQRSGYIMLIGVDPGVQGQGIGHALLEHAEAALFAATDSIMLLVSDFNIAAQRFYRGHGYLQVGAIPDYVITGVDELVFFKRRPSR